MSKEYTFLQVLCSTAGAPEEGRPRQPPARLEALSRHCPCGQCSREPCQAAASIPSRRRGAGM